MRSRAKVLFAVVSCLALLALTGAALAAQVYVPAQSSSGPGSEDGQLDKPRRAAIEQASGNLFVADSGNGRVQVFAPDGSFLTSFGQAELDAPFGIAIYESAGETEVYVSDPATNQVLRYDSDEAATPSFTVDAGFTSPAAGAGQLKVGDFAAALAVDPSNGDLWVADPGDDRAQRYDSSGVFELANDGSDSPGGAFTGLLDIAADSNGRLYAVDSDGSITGQPAGSGASGQSRVERFGPGGAHQLTLSGLHRPATVATNLATDQVAVSADQDNVDYNGQPSLHVYDATGTKLDDLRMGSGTQFTTVHGLAWRSSDQDVFSVNDVGYWNGGPNGSPSINRFELADEPTATIDPVANVTATGADFSGTVNPGGHTTTAHFELSSNGGSSWSELEEIAVCQVTSPGDCTSDEAVVFTATGLTPNVGYVVRLVAESSVASIASVPESFATDEAPPRAITDGAQRTQNSATFNGRVNPYGLTTDYYFEYGTSPGAYTNSVPASEDADAGSGTELAPVSQQASGLSPSTTYYYRLVATNTQGTSFGEEMAVTTLAAGQVMPDNYVEVGDFGKRLPGPGPAEFDGPRKLAVHEASGQILITDQNNNRVQVFAPTATSATYLTEFGSGTLSGPVGIAIDQSTGDVYVSSGGSNEIVKFERTEGNPPTFAPDPSFDSPGQGEGPEEIGSFSSALALDQSNGHLWVADSGNKRVVHLDASGAFVDSFDGSDSPNGPFTVLSDIAIDSTGAVVVAREPYVERFSQSGKHQLTIGGDFFGGYVGGVTIAVNAFDQIMVGAGYQDARFSIWENGNRVGDVTGPWGEIWGWADLAVNQQDGTLYALSAYHFGCCAINGVRVLVPGTRPTVTIEPVVASGSATAEVSGSVNPQGQATGWYFEYSRAGSDTWYPAPFPPADGGSGTSPQPVSHTLTGLDPNTAYEARLVARNEAGKVVSPVEGFTTGSGAPGVGATFAAPRTTATARLNARIDPNGEATTYYFEYGTDTSYGTSVPASLDGDAGSGTQSLLVSRQVAGLEPGTEYHYRVVAESSGGTTTGPDREFRTRTATEMSLPSRGFELVNTPEKGNGDPLGTFGPPPMMSEDGNRVIWGTCCGTPESPVGMSEYIARRTPSSPTGWTSKSVIPPQAELSKHFIPQDLLFLKGISAPDWSNGLLEVQRADAGTTIAIAEDGFTRIRPVYVSAPNGANTGQSKIVASRDLSRILMLIPERIDPGHPEGAREIYDVGSGSPELVSRMPDGTVPRCGVEAPDNLAAYYGFATARYPHWVSHDGSRVFFETAGDKDGCDVDTDLYVRDLEQEETELVSGPPVTGPSRPARLIRPSADGKRAVFATETRLVAEDADELNDLYLWTEGVGNQCLTCVVPMASVDSPGLRPVAVSPDLSHVYFSSRRVLVAGQGIPESGDLANLYVWHDGEVSYVGPGEAKSKQFSRDGSVFVFGSTAPNVTSESVAGVEQYYRYDHGDRSLECMTCPGSGLVVRGTQDEITSSSRTIDEEDRRSLSADGSTFVFATSTPLVPEDINGTRDIYEWRNGTLGLVTDGETPYAVSKMDLFSVSADGTAILFALQAHLTGFERDNMGQLYQARRGGGFYAPSPAPPCREDDCQGPLEPVPPLAPAGSAVFQGPGNQAAKKQQKKKRAKQKKKRAKQKKRQAKKRQASKQGRR